MSDVGELLAGRYRLRRQLGAGAMGVVWQAVDERLQRPVAVKQLIPQSGLDAARAEEARQRAMREGRLAARLHHPHAVAVHDVTEHEGLPVLVMEYVPCSSLADVLAAQGAMAPVAVAGIGAQAASALEAAHAVGIVHRDIKPGNVLLGEDGTVKITDFGISHAADDVAVTRTGILAGTPAYLAPEIAQGHPPTPGSDVFSLAATLYEAVEGRTPFGHGSDNSLALLHVVAAGNVLAPQRAGALTPVLERMLEANPAQRLPLAQVREAMHAVAAGAPLPDVVESSAPEAPTQPFRRVATTTTAPPGGGRNGTRLDARPLDQWSSAPSGGRARAATGSGGRARAAPGRLRHLLPIAAAVVIALLVGGLVMAQVGTSGDPARRASPPPPSIAPVQLERVVSDYYALLPEHPDNAWRRLGPGMKAQGHARYADFWATVAELTVLSPPRVTGTNTVRVGIQLTMRDGSKVREIHRIGMTDADGTPVIDTDTVLRTEHIAPPPPPPPPPPTEHKDEAKNEQSRKKDQKKNDEKGAGKENKKGGKDKESDDD